MLAWLGHDRASDAVRAADRTQRVGGDVLAFGVTGRVRRTDTDIAWGARDVEPCRYSSVSAAPSVIVVGSNSDQASALPPKSRSMVSALVPELGLRSPEISTNALNISGSFAVSTTAQVPPIDHPRMPQLDRFGLTPKFEII